MIDEIFGPEISPALKARDAKGPSSDAVSDGAPLLAIRRQRVITAGRDVVGALSDGAHNGGGRNGQDIYTGRILPVEIDDGLEWAVRRLTPLECERLMGFPDHFTRIPYRKKPAELCPDGPRYKAIGNSWTVNVASWIAERIEIVSKWE